MNREKLDIEKIKGEIDLLEKNKERSEAQEFRLSCCYEELGRKYLFIEDTDKAESAFLQAEEYVKKFPVTTENRYLWLFILSGRAMASLKKGRPNSVRLLVADAMGIAADRTKDEKYSDLEKIGLIKNFIVFAEFWILNKDIKQAKELLNDANNLLFNLDIPSLTDPSCLYLTALDCIGLAYNIDCLDIAKGIAKKYIAYAEKTSNEKNYIYFAYFYLGKIYLIKNQLAKAVSSFEMARTILSELDLRQQFKGEIIRATILNKLCNCYIDLNDYEKAEAQVQETASVFENRKPLVEDSKRVLAETYYLQAKIAGERKQPQKSEAFCIKAQRTYDSLSQKTSSDYNNIVFNQALLAGIYIKNKQYDLAIKYFTNAYQITVLLSEISLQFFRMQYKISHELANAYLHNSQFEKSFQYSEEALAGLEKLQSITELRTDDYFRKMRCLYTKVKFFCKSKKYVETIKNIYLLIELYESLRKQSEFSEKLKTLNFGNRIIGDIKELFSDIRENYGNYHRGDKVFIDALYLWCCKEINTTNELLRCEFIIWSVACCKSSNIEMLNIAYWFVKLFTIVDPEFQLKIVCKLSKEALTSFERDAKKIKERIDSLERETKQQKLFSLFGGGDRQDKKNTSSYAASSSASSCKYTAR